MAKQFFFRGYAGAVRRCFGFASTVIVGTAIAAQNAATQRAVSNYASPTAATQRSPEGRLDHRDRQCEYRERCARARVTDQGSPTITSGAPLRCGKARALVSVAFVLGQRSFCCVICGRTNRFVDPFPSIPRRR